MLSRLSFHPDDGDLDLRLGRLGAASGDGALRFPREAGRGPSKSSGPSGVRAQATQSAKGQFTPLYEVLLTSCMCS